MRDGIKFSPPDVKLDELGYLPNDKLLPDARRRLLKRRDSLFDSLSDVAIDRIYELQAMIAAWHLNLKDNKIKRQKKSREVKRSREQLSLERAQQAQLIMECRDAIENVQKELSKLKGHSACLVKVDPSSDPAIEPLKALILSTEQEIAVVVQEIETLKSELPMVIKKWGMGDKFRSVSSRKEAVEQKLNDLMSRLTDLKLQMQTHFDGAEENFKQKRVKVLAQIEEREREVEALNERLKLLESHLLQIDGKIALARIEVETYS
jgi:chromosome segregation ATPase